MLARRLVDRLPIGLDLALAEKAFEPADQPRAVEAGSPRQVAVGREIAASRRRPGDSRRASGNSSRMRNRETPVRVIR